MVNFVHESTGRKKKLTMRLDVFERAEEKRRIDGGHGEEIMCVVINVK